MDNDVYMYKVREAISSVLKGNKHSTRTLIESIVRDIKKDLLKDNGVKNG
jgi:hypothetical protein